MVGLFFIELNLLKSCPMGNLLISGRQSDQAEQVGSSKEKKAKNKKNKKHRGGGSETPAYEEGGRAGEQQRIWLEICCLQMAFCLFVCLFVCFTRIRTDNWKDMIG